MVEAHEAEVLGSEVPALAALVDPLAASATDANAPFTAIGALRVRRLGQVGAGFVSRHAVREDFAPALQAVEVNLASVGVAGIIFE